MCACMHFLSLEGIDPGVIHREVLKVQSLLWHSLCALPKDEALMFYFPMRCLGLKVKKKRKRQGCAKNDVIRMPIQWRSGGSYTLTDLGGIDRDIARYCLKHTSFPLNIEA